MRPVRSSNEQVRTHTRSGHLRPVSDAGSAARDDQAERHDAALARAAAARARMEQVAGRIADTEQYAAGVLDDVADQHPERAERLRAMAAHARDFAAHERAVSEGREV